MSKLSLIICCAVMLGSTGLVRPEEDTPSPLKEPVEKTWSLADAERRTGGMREEICLNGLWRFFPESGEKPSARPPQTGSGWGWFKVPGCWPTARGFNKPGATQKIYLKGARKELGLKLRSAWYRRTVKVPENWTGRSVILDIDLPQTRASVWVDGQDCGTIAFPGGGLDLTGKMLPGKEHDLAIFLDADPSGAARTQYMAAGRTMKLGGMLPQRGLVGDVFLKSRPAGTWITDTQIRTSVREKTITFDVGLAGAALSQGVIEVAVREKDGKVVRTFSNNLSGGAPVAAARRVFTAAWENPRLWDTDTPQNLYSAVVTLKDSAGRKIDEALPEEFGFREIRIAGREFLLNEKPLTLRSLAYPCRLSGADMTNFATVARILEKFKSLNVNHLIYESYSVTPGNNGYMRAFFETASRMGILTSFALPHAGSMTKWNWGNAKAVERFTKLSEYLIRRYQNVPGIVFYAMNHNATGFAGDQNPARLGGNPFTEEEIGRAKPEQKNNRQVARKSAAVIRALDPTRVVYHHSSGPLDGVYTNNCYLNWVPVQEREDWFAEWERHGNQPVFLIEYGVPFYYNWTNYRQSTPNPYRSLLLSEFDAEYLGETAYRFSSQKKFAADLQAQRLKLPLAGNFWPYIYAACYDREPNIVRARFVEPVLFAFRARGVSALPWDAQFLLKSTDSKWETQRPCAAPFVNLKRRGPVPDVEMAGQDFRQSAYGEFLPTEFGKALARAFRPVVARIVGNEEFSSKEHNCRPGMTLNKKILIINGSRQERKITWTAQCPEIGFSRGGEITVPAGRKGEVPLAIAVPESASARGVVLKAQIRDNDGEQSDNFVIDVLPAPKVKLRRAVGVWDPEKTAMPLLTNLGIAAFPVKDAAELAKAGILVIGRNGLDSLPWALAEAIREKDLRVLVLEQSYAVWERLGFRATERGIRNVFRPAGREIHDWNGAATLLPAYLPEKETPVGAYPSWDWNGFRNPRAWRAGNRGNVCSVVPERPQAGDFLPLMRCGFDLQYAAALESAAGRVIFSQFDFCGRECPEPEAENLLGELLARLDRDLLSAGRKLAVTDKTAADYARRLGFTPQEEVADGVLLLTAGAEVEGLAEKVRNGLNVLAVGLGGAELEKFFPGAFKTENKKYYPDFAPGLAEEEVFRGLSNAELNFRLPRTFDGFKDNPCGGNALAVARIGKGTVVACQLVPWQVEDYFQFRTVRRNQAYLLTRLLCNLGAVNAVSAANFLIPGYCNTSTVRLATGWQGLADKKSAGRNEKWFAADAQLPAGVRPVEVAKTFEQQFPELAKYDGLFWYFRDFDLPEAPRGVYDANFGKVDDESWIWVNGHFLGEVTRQSHPNDYYRALRRYSVPADLLREKGNRVVILCNDVSMQGGVMGIPKISGATKCPLYLDTPIDQDDPYRYYRW